MPFYIHVLVLFLKFLINDEHIHAVVSVSMGRFLKSLEKFNYVGISHIIKKKLVSRVVVEIFGNFHECTSLV